MNFSSAISFPFRGPHAWPNIGLILVCFIIPVVGPIVVVGYIIGLEKILINNIYADAPRFDFGKFSPYLTRGVFPFLASLVMMLIIYALLIPVAIVFVVAFVVAQNNTAAIVVLVVLAFLTYIALILVLSTIMQPLMFKCGLEGSFQAAFDHRFLFDYLKRVGWLSLGVHLASMVLFIPLLLIACVPIVGAYAALAVLVQAQAHLNTQLYLTYLERGGTALVIKPDPLDEAGFPVLPSAALPPSPPAPSST